MKLFFILVWLTYHKQGSFVGNSPPSTKDFSCTRLVPPIVCSLQRCVRLGRLFKCSKGRLRAFQNLKLGHDTKETESLQYWTRQWSNQHLQQANYYQPSYIQTNEGWRSLCKETVQCGIASVFWCFKRGVNTVERGIEVGGGGGVGEEEMFTKIEWLLKQMLKSFVQALRRRTNARSLRHSISSRWHLDLYQHVESKFNEFKSVCFNNHSTFLLVSRMLNEV